MAEDSIVCPTCARVHPASERFCEACGMPLVHAAADVEQETSERQRWARKIKPQYAEGKLVKVAHAKDKLEAELIAGLLLEEGIPCLMRSSIGGYTPMVDPREIMVPESGAEAAREALAFQRD
ncbi:MAG TPA: DUF2007 domain-containing protein [Solirubrobacteraceae bacterium]|jgi:hypothetical protein|nr:DUF2007 domain-containing protein [Solirubrobacteraceae bacterium]